MGDRGDQESGAVRNPFDVGGSAARTYAAARPYYHPLALDLAFPLVDDRPGVGLDVGCGTGLSTRALADRVGRVVGVDPSAPMLAARVPVPGVLFVRGRAERLPVRTGAVDVVTCAASMHWFTEPAFAELARVTRPGGHAIVYGDFFQGELGGEPGFGAWLRDTYLPRCPSPVRRSRYDEAAMAAAGFASVGQDERAHAVPMSRSALAAYLMSQSNATTAVGSGAVTEAALRAWIEAELDRVVVAEIAPARFVYRVRVARRA